MRLILANGTELTPIIATGELRYVQGTNRDALTFVFANTSLDELDVLFTAENCKTLKIVNGNEEYIHRNYIVRAELAKKEVEVQKPNAENEVVTEQRVFVTMAESTFAEMQMANLTETVDVLVLESLMA